MGIANWKKVKIVTDSYGLKNMWRCNSANCEQRCVKFLKLSDSPNECLEVR